MLQWGKQVFDFRQAFDLDPACLEIPNGDPCHITAQNTGKNWCITFSRPWTIELNQVLTKVLTKVSTTSLQMQYLKWSPKNYSKLFVLAQILSEPTQWRQASHDTVQANSLCSPTGGGLAASLIISHSCCAGCCRECANVLAARRNDRYHVNARKSYNCTNMPGKIFE